MTQSINPVDVVANVATGGLYGAGEALAEGRPGSALENLGPFGSAVHPISPQAADIGNLAGAGAGIGGGLASGQGIGGGGFGAASSPYYGGAAGLPVTGGASATFAGTPEEVAALNIGALQPGTGAAGGALGGAAAGGMGNTGALLGAAGAQQLATLLGGMSPLSFPTGGATGAGPAPAAGLTPNQQAALLAAQQSEAHRGLAPRFEQRMRGTREQPGISTLQDVSQYYSR